MRQLIFKAILCGVLFVVLLEVFARAEDTLRWGAPFWGHYELEGIRHSDARGTQRCAPGRSYKHFRIDERGFRETEFAGPARETVVWLGASEAFGLYESPGNDVANQLERSLRARGSDVDVINAACFGMNLLRLQRVLEEPLLGMGVDALMIYPTPHFYLDLQPVRPDRPQPAQAAGVGFVSRAVTKSRDVLKSFLPMALQDLIRERQEQGALQGEVWPDPPAERLRQFAAHLEALLGVAQGSGARVAILTHANAFHAVEEIDESVLQAWRKFYPRAGGDVLIRFDAEANEVIRRLAAANDVELIDLAETVSGDPKLFADFSHFTDAGAAKAANRLAAWLAEEPSAIE
ncbi:MAG: SGNH/GDSL hydrolase family protein [Pseudomonadota bacterium]